MSEEFYKMIVAKTACAGGEHQAAVITDVKKRIDQAAVEGHTAILYNRPFWCPDSVPMFKIIRKELHTNFSVVWQGNAIKIRWG